MSTSSPERHRRGRTYSSAAIWLAVAGMLGMISIVVWFAVGWFFPFVVFCGALLCYLVGVVQLFRRR